MEDQNHDVHLTSDSVTGREDAKASRSAGVRVDDASLTDREVAFVMAVLRYPGSKRPLDDEAGYVREDGGSIWLRPEHQGLVTAVGSWKWEPTEKLLGIVRAALGVSVRAEPSSQRINELARQSGLPMSWLDTGKASAWPELERFARLVLADGVRVLPPHLREDAKPLSQCSKCGRKSWDATEAEKTCGMPQPNGYQCAGIMDPDGVKGDDRG